MENNVYQAPEADLGVKTSQDQIELASRWARLGAAIIDGIILALLLAPIQYFAGMYDMEENVGIFDNLGQGFLMGLLGVLIFAVINGKLLLNCGQTVGKKLLGIQIVDETKVEQATNNQIVKRYATYFGLSIVPVIGGLLSLMNVLFIFNTNKQCVHDLAAKTIVIRKP